MNIEERIRSISEQKIAVGVVGLGYVGLPLLLEFCRKGFRVVGFDILADRCKQLLDGDSYIKHISSESIAEEVRSGRLDATADFGRVAEVDALLLCVPTPLTRHREPDLSYILATAKAAAPHLKDGCLVVLESTTYPGTTRDELVPILESHGKKSGRDFFVAYSPEREDPGNPTHSAAVVPKVVGADDAAARALAEALYKQVVPSVIPVSGADVAEAVKLTENIFRSVNIALVNELKTVYSKMGIDVWEVIDAAKTKPFGYMPFYPGPGLGGHCIPIDPFYLTWKAREYGCHTRFIELAGEVNCAMPQYVIDILARALNDHGKPLKNAKILLLGLAYKKNVDDPRESPAFKLIELMERGGAHVDYYDPFIPEMPGMREYPDMAGRRSIAWNEQALASYDAALIATAHDGVDYEALVHHSQLVIDTRNATRAIAEGREKIVQA